MQETEDIMRMPVDFPEFLPVRKSEDKRSRQPVMVFGRRGTVARNTRWTSEEWASRRPEHAGGRAMHYIGGLIPFDEVTGEADRKVAFSTLMTWCTLAETAGLSVVCVPAWFDYRPDTQDLILIAAQYQVEAVTAAELISGDLTLKKRATEVRVVTVHGSGTGASFTTVSSGRRKPFDQNACVAWLSGAAESHPSKVDVFVALHSSELRRRDVAGAKDVAGQLVRDGWNRTDIQRYLETFGFKSSTGIVGRWPADRLAEVIAAVNP